MSDGISDHDKDQRAIQEWWNHISFFANSIHKQAKHIKDREAWEIKVSELVENVTEEIYDKLETLRGD